MTHPSSARQATSPPPSRLTVLGLLGCVVGLGLVASAPPSATGRLVDQLPQRGGEPPPILPDMTPLRARGLYITVANGIRKIRFATSLGNVGLGPMEIRPNRVKPCAAGKRHASQIIYRDVDGSGRFDRDVDTTTTRKSAGCMVFHPQHNHWHFEAAARYRLYKAGSPDKLIGRSRKTSFCLRDSQRMPASYGDFHVSAFYGDCNRDTPQGISRGWADLYESFLSGQALMLPPRVRNNVYCLQIIVDPKHLLWESDEDNNVSVKAFRLVGGTTIRAVPKNSVCTATPPPA